MYESKRCYYILTVKVFNDCLNLLMLDIAYTFAHRYITVDFFKHRQRRIYDNKICSTWYF